MQYRDATVRERPADGWAESGAIFELSCAAMCFAFVWRSRVLRFASGRGLSLPCGRVSAVFGAIFLCCCCVAHAAEDVAAKFSTLADQWEAKGKTAEAKLAREWLPPTKNRQILYSFLPADAPLPPIDPTFETEFRQIRDAYAEELFRTAYKQINAKDDAAAFQMLHQVIRESPDHAAARYLLGHVRQRDKAWRTDFSEQITGTAVTIPHPKLGWPARSYSKVTSSHFEILTNGNIAEARKVAAELEQLYCTWRQVFYAQTARPGALAARAKGGMEPLFAERKAKHKVVLFRSKADYVTKLRPQLAGIESTTGLYFDQDRVSYFYVAPPTDRLAIAARYHEVVHQLLHAHLGGDFIPGKEFNFWAVEGIATYFESLAHGSGYISLGGWEADRLQFARYRTLNTPREERPWPLSKLVAVSQTHWQAAHDVRQLYSRSAAMSQFLLDGENGRHRAPFLDFIGLLYQQKDKLTSVAELTTTSAEELDEQFVQYLRVTDNDLQAIIEPARLRNLSLGRTQVTDAGLSHLKGCPQLEWLDLTQLQVTDEGLQVIAQMPHLKQLFLEGTTGTPKTLAIISGLHELEELDLTGWSLKDEDLGLLAGLKRLETLYLTNTPITDAGLLHLKPLSNLKTVETSATKVTATGRKQLGLAP